MKVTPKLVRHRINPSIVRLKYKFYDMINFLHSISKIVWKWLSIISTFAVFAGLILFVWGKLSNYNISDNDLLMKGVTKQLPSNIKIEKMYFVDLFGFGNDTMIVTAGTQIDSQTGLLIYDKANNSFLSQVYNLFGYGSDYKLKYSDVIQNDHINDVMNSGFMGSGFDTELMNTIDLTNDNFKEIIERNVNYGGSGGSYNVNIISYSFKSNSYYSLGTLPPFGPYNLDDDKKNTIPALNNSDDTSTTDDIDYFFKGYDNSIFLVRAHCTGWSGSHADPMYYNISVFSPYYNDQDDTLSWHVLFSKNTEKPIDRSAGSVISFLKCNEFSYSNTLNFIPNLS